MNAPESTSTRPRRLRPADRAAWTGLYVAPAAWLVHHQVGSDLVYSNCAVYGPALVLVLGLACAAIALAGGWLSWRVRSPLDGDDSASSRFGARISALAGLLFALVIVAQSAAAFFYAGCEQ